MSTIYLSLIQHLACLMNGTCNYTFHLKCLLDFKINATKTESWKYNPFIMYEHSSIPSPLPYMIRHFFRVYTETEKIESIRNFFFLKFLQQYARKINVSEFTHDSTSCKKRTCKKVDSAKCNNATTMMR